MDHIVLISDRQMNAKSGAEADKGKQSSGPTGVETHKERQAAEKMDGHRDPDRHVGNRYVHAREILRCAARIAQLEDAVPDEKARHQ